MHHDTIAAIRVIGEGADDDHRLRPEAWVPDLGPEAGALTRVLMRSAPIAEHIDSYQSNRLDAARGQRRFKFYVGWAATLSFIAVVAAAVQLVVFGFDLPEAAAVVEELSFVTGGAIALSFILSLLGAWRGPFSAWMTSRALTETARLRLFNEIAAAKEAHRGDELPLLPLQLEFFRRYQLDVQRLYYSKRGGEHRRAVYRAHALRAIALILVIAAAVPPIASLIDVPWEQWPGVRDILAALGHGKISPDLEARVFVGLGTIGAALQGLLAARLLMSQHERNATRYAATLANLEALAERPLDEARQAAVDNDRAAVLGFIALVQEQISSEHREWVALQTIAPDLSLARLRELALPRLG